MPLELWWIQSPVVTEPGPDVLLIRSRRLAILSLYGRMSPVGLIVLLVLAVQGGGTMWILAAIVGASSCLPLLGLLTQGRQAQFDRARGVLTLKGRLGRRAPRPLASVKAVEVEVGGRHLPVEPSARRPAPAATQSRLSRERGRRAGAADGGSGWRPSLACRCWARGRRRPLRRSPAGRGGQPSGGADRSPLPSGKASIRGPAQSVEGR